MNNDDDIKNMVIRNDNREVLNPFVVAHNRNSGNLNSQSIFASPVQLQQQTLPQYQNPLPYSPPLPSLSSQLQQQALPQYQPLPYAEPPQLQQQALPLCHIPVLHEDNSQSSASFWGYISYQQHPQYQNNIFPPPPPPLPSPPLYDEEEPNNCKDIFCIFIFISIYILDDDESNIKQIQHLDLLNILYEEIKRSKSGMEILVILKLSKKIKLQLVEKLSLEDKIRIFHLIREEYNKIDGKRKYKIIELLSYFTKSYNDLDILYKINGCEVFVDLLNSKFVKDKNILINFIRSNIPNPNSILDKQKS